MKVYNYDIVFREFPFETTLALNISNCPCHCKGCHSSHLAEDIGEDLTPEFVDRLIKENPAVTCVGIMGGDADPNKVMDIAAHITEHHNVKVGWYSGRDELVKGFDCSLFDYIKLGHYDEERGPLTSNTTNQKMYRIKRDVKRGEGKPEITLKDFSNITGFFWM